MSIFLTRGRYALRVMIDLAQNAKENFIPMKDFAARQGISLKYLEQILPILSKNELVMAVHEKAVATSWQMIQLRLSWRYFTAYREGSGSCSMSC